MGFKFTIAMEVDDRESEVAKDRANRLVLALLDCEGVTACHLASGPSVEIEVVSNVADLPPLE